MPSSQVSNSSQGADRVALVTGAAQGIGRAIALRLAADGLDVALDDLPSKHDLLHEVVKEIEQLERRAIALTFDVAKEEEVKSMVDETVKKLGRLDVMVANAGILGNDAGSIMAADASKWEAVYDVNVRGVIFCYKYAAQQMVKQGSRGRIIGASSLCGLRGFANHGAYCMSKAAVRSLTQTASLELRGYGITVNAYSPGFIATTMSMSSTDEELCSFSKKFLKLHDAPVGQPEDVADLVSYFVSPGAQTITGQTVSINCDAVFH